MEDCKCFFERCKCLVHRRPSCAYLEIPERSVARRLSIFVLRSDVARLTPRKKKTRHTRNRQAADFLELI